MKRSRAFLIVITILIITSCREESKQKEVTSEKEQKVTAEYILGNTEYQAISYGGYRYPDHDVEPTIDELKEDMRILYAMGIRILRTYKVHLPHASNVLKAIKEIKSEDSDFEMYVMLGAWIDCKNAWTDLEPDHNQESERNAAEIKEAVHLAKTFPDIVKVIAVGNEAMVKWAEAYYVQPNVILKWVNHLQNLKNDGKLPKDLWVTSSDNFASWGGGGEEYHVEDLNELIKAVDFISMHTYPMHDSHYQPDFWLDQTGLEGKTDMEIIDAAMLRSKKYAMKQYESVKAYMQSLGVDIPIHIGETGWASFSAGLYGPEGSRACDEYKEALYYKHMRDWTDEAGLSCFYFEGFDEPWKGGNNPGDSEKHFGLFTIDGKAKYAIWDLVDSGVFEGLTRNGQPITKTFNGSEEEVMKTVLVPPRPQEVVSH